MGQGRFSVLVYQTTDLAVNQLLTLESGSKLKDKNKLGNIFLFIG